MSLRPCQPQRACHPCFFSIPCISNRRGTCRGRYRASALHQSCWATLEASHKSSLTLMSILHLFTTSFLSVKSPLNVLGLPVFKFVIIKTDNFNGTVSKLRFYQELSSSLDDLNADTVLLLIAMKLHTQPVNNKESPYHHLYHSAKSCFSYVEASNVISIRLLQAALLIALYEISNAMYPAAYLTTGHCARLGHVIGIHDQKRAPQMLCLPSRFDLSRYKVLVLIMAQKHLLS